MGELLIHLPDERPAESDPEFEGRLQLVEAMLDDTPEIWRKPKVIGSLSNPDLFSADIDLGFSTDGRNEKRVASNGIQLPFSIDADRNAVKYEIPDNLDQLREAIGMIAAHEHGNYPDWRPTPAHARLTVDQRIVPPGESQRDGGIHRDGYMGRWEHIYLVSSSNPTQFFWTDEPKSVQGKGMGLTASLEPVGLEGPYVPADYEIVMANTTTPHASPVIQEGGPRTFLRLSYEHFLE